MSKIGRIYQGLEEIQKYYQGGVLQKLFFDWKHYIGTELNIEYGKECAGRNVVIKGKTYQNLFKAELSQGHTNSSLTAQRNLRVNSEGFTLEVKTYTISVPSGYEILVYKNYVDINSVYIVWANKIVWSNSSKTNNVRIMIKKTDNTEITVDEVIGKVVLLEGDYTDIDLPNSINGIESVAEKERNLADYIVNAIGTLGTKGIFDNKNCLKITSTFSRTIVLPDVSDYRIYVRAYANNTENKSYSIGNFNNTYIAPGIKKWQSNTLTGNLNKFAIYNYQNSEVYIDLDTLSLVRVNNPYPLKLNVRGKNLFNPNNLEYGNINTSTGKNLGTTNTMKRTIDYIKVNLKTQYIINSSCRVFEYDKMKNFLSSKAMAGKFTTSENTEYIKIHGNTTAEFVDGKNIQLEEGTVSTSYEPYREPTITNINLPIPLRSLPNNVCDTIEGDKLVQRVGKIVFDGSDDENWHVSNSLYFALNHGSIKTPKEFFNPNSTEYLNAISNINISLHTILDNKNGFGITYCYFWRLNLEEVDVTKGATVEDLKAYLQENPVTVYYELAEPIETPITPDMILINGEPITDTVSIKLPNEVSDSIENGYYVKRVGKVTFDGSEDWKSGRTSANILVFYLANTDFKELSSMICGSYKVQATTIEDKSIYCGNAWRPQIRDDSCATVEEFKVYLQQNPVTVWYELATPLKIPLFSIKEGLTTLKSTNNITPQMELDCLVRDDFQNLCDNVWEVGDINYDTGVNEDSTNRIRLVNDIQVKPNTKYRWDVVNKTNGTAIGIRHYDISKTYINGNAIGNIGNSKNNKRTFTTPANCYYIRFIAETTDTNFKIYLKEVIE